MDMFEDQMDNLEHYAINSKKKVGEKDFVLMIGNFMN